MDDETSRWSANTVLTMTIKPNDAVAILRRAILSKPIFGVGSARGVLRGAKDDPSLLIRINLVFNSTALATPY